MRIGIDFDNTIVSYDALFHQVAMEQGHIDRSVPVSKGHVRDVMRQAGREPEWTAMQGLVYGARMAEAAPFPGVQEFFRQARTRGIELVIVSHKTRHPFAGPPYDLHAAALGWLEVQGFFEAADLGLGRDRVHLMPTKEGKLARIGELACDAFIDDLPEILSESGFPAGVERLLFDPSGRHRVPADWRSYRSWSALGTWLETL